MSEHEEPMDSMSQKASDAMGSQETGTTRLERRHEIREELRLSGDLRSMKARAKAEQLINRVSSGFIYGMSILVCMIAGP